MQQIRNAAWLSIGRGCAYGTLAIMCLVVGLSWNPLLAARTGGVLLTLMAVVLLYLAERATSVPYRSTEVWLILSEAERPPHEGAQVVISLQRREALQTFAAYSAAAAALFWAGALILWLFA